MDLCVQESEYNKYKSLDLALAIIVCGRKGIKVKELWHPKLEIISGKTFEEIEPIYKKIFVFYRKCFAKATNPCKTSR